MDKKTLTESIDHRMKRDMEGIIRFSYNQAIDWKYTPHCSDNHEGTLELGYGFDTVVVSNVKKTVADICEQITRVVNLWGFNIV